MRRPRRAGLILVLAGLALMLAGFAYAMIFAGIPFPDPTPEMAADYARQLAIADGLALAGLIVFAAGAIWGLVRLLMQRS